MSKISKPQPRYERYEKNKYSRKRKKVRVPLKIGKDVLLLSSRIKKKSAPGLLYKSSIDNKSYFDKKIIFTIIKRQDIHNKTFYWLKKADDKKVKFRVIREKIYALSGNFI